jgi:hypothetical protein
VLDVLSPVFPSEGQVSWVDSSFFVEGQGNDGLVGWVGPSFFIVLMLTDKVCPVSVSVYDDIVVADACLLLEVVKDLFQPFRDW